MTPDTPDRRAARVVALTDRDRGLGALLAEQPAQLETSSGQIVDLQHPDPRTIELVDLARGQAYSCRFGGHVRRYYSVAEHAVLVHDLLEHTGADPATCRAGLFHDAAEALLGDLVAPLKWALRAETLQAMGITPTPEQIAAARSSYDVLSDRMDAVIAARHRIDLRALHSRAVCAADLWALQIEARALLTSGAPIWRGTEPPRRDLPDTVTWQAGLAPDAAAALWLERAHTPQARPPHPDTTGALVTLKRAYP